MRFSSRAGRTRADDETDQERRDREDEERRANKRETGFADTDEERRDRERDDDDDDDMDGDSDTDREEMRGSGVLARARARERGRARAILSSPAAARQPALAAELACSSLSRGEALRILEKSAGHGRNATTGLAAPNGHAAVQNSWDRAFTVSGIAVKR
jgi:hypothetical protein